jgi:hypothetical protein
MLHMLRSNRATTKSLRSHGNITVAIFHSRSLYTQAYKLRLIRLMHGVEAMIDNYTLAFEYTVLTSRELT